MYTDSARKTGQVYVYSLVLGLPESGDSVVLSVGEGTPIISKRRCM